MLNYKVRKFLEYLTLSLYQWFVWIPFLTPYLFWVVYYTPAQYAQWIWSSLPFEIAFGYIIAKIIVYGERRIKKFYKIGKPCEACGRC